MIIVKCPTCRQVSKMDKLRKGYIDGDCVICMDKVDKLIFLDCGHINICEKCIDDKTIILENEDNALTNKNDDTLNNELIKSLLPYDNITNQQVEEEVWALECGLIVIITTKQVKEVILCRSGIDAYSDIHNFNENKKKHLTGKIIIIRKRLIDNKISLSDFAKGYTQQNKIKYYVDNYDIKYNQNIRLFNYFV